MLYAGQFVVGKIPMLDSVWDVAHTALRPVVGGAVGVVMAQHAQASSAAVIAAAALGGGTALAAHVVKSGVRVGVNTSPEPFSNIVASLLEDAGVVGLVSFAVFHPVPAAIIAAVALAAGIVVFALLASRIRRPGAAGAKLAYGDHLLQFARYGGDLAVGRNGITGASTASEGNSSCAKSSWSIATRCPAWRTSSMRDGPAVNHGEGYEAVGEKVVRR